MVLALVQVVSPVDVPVAMALVRYAAYSGASLVSLSILLFVPSVVVRAGLLLTLAVGCKGTGVQRHKRRIAVTVPPGVDDGTTVRLSGEGDAGLRGGSPGNLYVVLSVAKHKFFTRDGDNVLFELPINFAQAALGAEVEVPTLYGKSKLKMPAGSQTGTIFRLKDKGIPHLHGGGRGDQLVRLLVVTPESLTKEQRRLFEELAKSLSPTKSAGAS